MDCPTPFFDTFSVRSLSRSKKARTYLILSGQVVDRNGQEHVQQDEVTSDKQDDEVQAGNSTKTLDT